MYQKQTEQFDGIVFVENISEQEFLRLEFDRKIEHQRIDLINFYAQQQMTANRTNSSLFGAIGAGALGAILR